MFVCRVLWLGISVVGAVFHEEPTFLRHCQKKNKSVVVTAMEFLLESLKSLTWKAGTLGEWSRVVTSSLRSSC